MLKYPQIDPVIFHLGPIEPRWYGMMYLLGFIYTYFQLKKYSAWLGLPNQEVVDSILGNLVLGMILCARAVYVIFYNWEETMNGPWWEMFAVWHGGLAFHGGLLGVILASIYVTRKYHMPWLRLTDVLATCAPVGLGLGRIANFINGELFGRVTDVPWAMVFPGGGPLPRHPSQLYESALEGIVLFVILQIVWRRRPPVGVTSAIFLLCYALIRISVEFVREPDAQVGFVIGPLTMGQLLSATMLIGGGILLRHALTRGAKWDSSLARKK
jgi:phosphatidylglycerol:prolipoprotein diacylglycerol transferase